MKTYLTSIPKSLEPFEKCPKVTLSDVLRNIPAIKRRTKEFGCWPFDTDDLIIKLLKGEMSLDDTLLQAILLDWIESEDYNKFLNLETGEFIYAKSAKGAMWFMRRGRPRRGMPLRKP